MRALLPVAVAEVDLAEVYAYPQDRASDRPGDRPSGEAGDQTSGEASGQASDRAWIRANMVASVDGAISVAGRSGGLSSPGDKQLFHLLRDLCDAVIVGAGTVRAEGYVGPQRDDARQAWRRERGLSDVPVMAVVSGSLELHPASPLFTAAVRRPLVVTTEEAAAERGSIVAEVADLVTTPGERVDVGAAVDALAARGLCRLLCEGGPMLLGQLAAAGRLDELCLTVSPLLVGGAAARVLSGPVLDPPGPLRLASVLEEDGSLFTRWLAGPAGPADPVDLVASTR